MTVFPVEIVGLLFVVPAVAGGVVIAIGAVDAVWSTVEARRADGALLTAGDQRPDAR